MGKVRSATAALEAERDKLVAKRDGWLKELAQLDDLASKMNLKYLNLKGEVDRAVRDIAARQQAIDLLNGDTPSAEAVSVAQGATPTDTSAMVGQPKLSPEAAALVAAAHDGEEDDPPEEPSAAKPVKGEKGATVRTLKPGQNPAKEIERLRAEDAEASAAG